MPVKRQRASFLRARRLVLWCGVAALGLGALAIGSVALAYSRASDSNVGELSFSNPLAVPPIAESSLDDEGRKVFDLRFVAGETELVPGLRTPTWGVNGTYLGPTLRATRGDDVVINVSNGVGEATTLHWHGMHLPAKADGGPHQMIEPGETWSPSWTIDQPAATLWYHPHLHGATADHVYRGAAGMFIVDERDVQMTPQGARLPDRYGVDDIPVIIQDKDIGSHGQLGDGQGFVDGLINELGVLGDDILVNGTYDPHFDATTELVRFRLLNASNARIYDLGFTDDRSYWLVGTDGGLLEQPQRMSRLRLSPGERAEIVVEIAPGDEVVLRSFAPDLGLDGVTARFNGGDDVFDILQVRGASQLDESAEIPDHVAVEQIDERDVDRTRSFELRAREINGRKMDMNRIDEVIELGSTEIWELTNAHGTPHSFHPHLVHFKVLDFDGRAPPPHLSGWKDTIFLPPRSTARVIARFEDHSDPTTPYMFHCHILEHEDEGMMGQFVVVEPGDDPDLSTGASGADGHEDHHH
jgi:FtsP/CotA-like multicopper oxidase with cupredoxin domain